jgi:uncharacterized protein DUF6433
MRIGVGEFLEQVSKTRKKQDKVAALKHNDSYVLRTVLQGAFDPRIKWVLPEGEPPYTPNSLVDQENVFIHDCRKLKYFIEGGAPNLTPVKRERMFIELLEAVDPRDAKLICSMKDKKLPWPGITAELVKEAFPGLLPE